MKLGRSKIIIYLDILIFFIVTISSTWDMVSSLINMEIIVKPVHIFIMTYLVNSVLYRISINTYVYKFFKNDIFNFFLSTITVIAVLNTLLFIVYLIIMAFATIRPTCIHDIICNYITYATIVGSWIIGNLALDNLTSFYNVFLREPK